MLLGWAAGGRDGASGRLAGGGGLHCAKCRNVGVMHGCVQMQTRVSMCE